MAEKITKRADDYSQWYLDIVNRAGLAENSDVRGCMVIKPNGYAVWEKMQRGLDRLFKDTGHVNAYFPLFIPESGADDSNAMNMVRAIADFDAAGYACFAVDSVLDLEGNLRPGARLFAESFASTAAILPLIKEFRRTGKIHAVYHEENAAFLPIQLEKYLGAVPYINMGYHTHGTDHRHRRMPDADAPKPCFGYIIETGPFELYLAGQFHLHLVPNEPPGWLKALYFPVVATPPDFLSVEEGILDEEGNFTATRKRNGDEVVFGRFWTAPDVGVVRVRLTPCGEAP